MNLVDFVERVGTESFAASASTFVTNQNTTSKDFNNDKPNLI